MNPVDPHQVNRELQRLARERHGRNTQALQVLYAIEGFLRRLSVTGYRDQIVLKGGILLAVLDARRVTRDVDLSIHGLPNEALPIREVIAEIASTTLHETDGIVFEPASVSMEPIRETARYPGVRAKLQATIGMARLLVTIDCSFGDPGEVEEIRYPELLGGPGIALRAYPIERALAEKIATMIERSELNTRDRDFADVWVLSRTHRIEADRLRPALQAVAEHRYHAIVPLSDALAELPDRQRSYDALRRRASFALAPPDRWSELIADVIAFVDPLVRDDTGQLAAWDPAAHRWV